MAKSIGSNVTVVLSADSSQMAAGMMKAQAISKQAANNIKSTWASVAKGMLIGVGMTVATTAITTAISALKNSFGKLRAAAEQYRQEAHEAIEMSEALGVSVRSFYLMSAAAKNAPIELIGKIITRYNMAVSDSGKANAFAALGLKRMAMEGDNAVDVMLNLVTALQKVAPARRVPLLKDLLGLRPDKMMEIMPLFSQTPEQLKQRMSIAEKYFGIPNAKSLAAVDILIDERLIGEQIAKGIGRRFGQITTGPLDIGFQKIKNAFMASVNELMTESFNLQEKGTGSQQGYDFIKKITPLYTMYRGIRGMIRANADLSSPMVKEQARREYVAEELGSFEKKLQERLTELKTGGKFYVELDELISKLRTARAPEALIEQKKAAMLGLENQVKQAERLKKITDDTKDPLEVLKEELADINTLFGRDATIGNATRALDGLEKKWGLLDDPVNRYLDALKKIQQIHDSGLGKNPLAFWQAEEAKKSERAGFLESLGIARDPLQTLKDRARLLKFAGGFKEIGLTNDERARSIAALFNQLYPQLGRQGPLEGLTAGSVGAARAVMQWQIDSKREGMTANDEIKRRMDEANRLNQLQLDEAKRIAKAIENNGIAVLEDE